MRAPAISLVAHDARGGGFVFVRVPDEHGRYLRTDMSVVTVACPMCKAAIGEPCTAGSKRTGYSATTHYVRRNAHKLAGFNHGRRAEALEAAERAEQAEHEPSINLIEPTPV